MKIEPDLERLAPNHPVTGGHLQTGDIFSFVDDGVDELRYKPVYMYCVLDGHHPILVHMRSGTAVRAADFGGKQVIVRNGRLKLDDVEP